MHSKRVFHNFPSKSPEPKCNFQKIQSRGSLQIHPNSSQNSETLSDAPNHHSWSISYAFSRRNPDFENLIFARSGNSQPIPNFFKPSTTLRKPKFSKHNYRRPGVSNCQNLRFRLAPPFESVAQGSQYRRMYILIMRLSDKRFFRDRVRVMPLDRKVASRR